MTKSLSREEVIKEQAAKNTEEKLLQSHVRKLINKNITFFSIRDVCDIYPLILCFVFCFFILSKQVFLVPSFELVAQHCFSFRGASKFYKLQPT